MLKKILIDKSKVNSLKTIGGLQDHFDWLHPNSRKMMWQVFEHIHHELKPESFNNKREWSNTEKEVIKRRLTDPFSKSCMSQVSYWTGRSPFAIYSIWILLMWEVTKKDPKRVLLKRTLKAAVRHGYAEWDESN